MPSNRDGSITPDPWKPLTGHLFGVTPPNPEEDPATHRTYKYLRAFTARAIAVLLQGVRRAYEETTPPVAPKLRGATKHALAAYCSDIALMLDDLELDEPLSPEELADQLSRFVRTLGWVIDNPRPGPKHNWPIVDVPEDFDVDEIMEYVDAAFRGNWNHQPEYHEGQA